MNQNSINTDNSPREGHCGFNIIVAASENNVIGYQGGMPWHLGADLKYFKSMTMGHAIIMGRKTFESIGRALPGRRNMVISRNADLHLPEGVELYPSLEAALDVAPDGAFVMGGGQIYQQAWSKATRYYITRVHTVVEQYDTVVPSVPADCHLVSSEDHLADEKNDYDITFEVWSR